MHGAFRAIKALAFFSALLSLGACINDQSATETGVIDDGLTCGPGTEEIDGLCVAIDDGTDEPSSPEPDEDIYDLDVDYVDDDEDVVVPYGDSITVEWDLLPSRDVDNMFFVGENLTESWCETDIPIYELDDDHAVIFLPGRVLYEESYVFGAVRLIEDDVCNDSDDWTDWSYLDHWFGLDVSICQNTDDEDRFGLLFLVRDGQISNPLDCNSGNAPNDSGNDADDDGDVAGGIGGDESEGETGTDDDGDGFTSIETGGSDCNDGWYYTYPGAPEYNDDEDNDCDGTEDEGCSGVPVNGLCS